jgi:predicted nucleotidyltransferase
MINYDQIRHYAPEIKRIAQKHGISRVYIAGSVARGEETPESDVDFLVEMQLGASLFGVAGFGYEVEQLLGVQVDVIPLSVLPEVKDREFAARIQSDAVSI